MILAAGFGTRLLPTTKHTPKALFPVNGQPIIDRTIRQLIHAGCKEILINTHHLHRQIEVFIQTQKYPISVQTRYEPMILGTGGGVKNAADFFGDLPFVVLNSDIVTDIPLEKVYSFHCSHADAVTMVVYDDPRVNTVWVDDHLRVLGFDGPSAHLRSNKQCRFTFTGIQVLDPEVLNLIPDGGFSSSVDTYRRIIRNGETVRAYLAKNYRWRDIGTHQSYRAEVLRTIIPEAFDRAFGAMPENKPQQTRLAGDGSDRRWYRLSIGQHSLIMVDHGLREGNGLQEVDAFIDIGRHLHRQRIAVPELIAWDRFSGLVLIKDLGDNHLQAVIRNATNPDRVAAIYQQVIDEWIRLATKGHDGFNPDWTYQTPRYDAALILEKECRYFVDAFLNGYLGMDKATTKYQADFVHLAGRIMAHAINGLIHRDCQSRNIMVKDDRIYFIDFQGARSGPVQYDLASLLIDPYVALPAGMQRQLCGYAFEQLSRVTAIHRHQFFAGYRYCALSRNLQILGAFGFLTQVKGKPHFKAYIPAAIHSLGRCLNAFKPDEFPALKSVLDCIKMEGINPKSNRRSST